MSSLARKSWLKSSLDQTSLRSTQIGNAHLEIGTVVRAFSSLDIPLAGEREEALKELARLGQVIDLR